MVGAGKLSAVKDNDFLKFGGAAAGKLRAGSDAVTIVAELPDGAMKPEQAAAVAAGVRLRAYKFDRYKTKKKDGEDAALRADVSLAVGDVGAARKAFAPGAHIVDGVIIGARTRQRAAERAVPGGVRAPREPVAQARRRASRCSTSRP